MRQHYATTYQCAKYAAAFRHGVLTIVRLADQTSAMLSLEQTNRFRRLVMDYELTETERDPVDMACACFVVYLKKRKWIKAMYEGAIIEVSNAPIEVSK